MLFHRPALLLTAVSLLLIVSQAQAEEKKKAEKEKVIALYNGKNLEGWKEALFGGEGEVYIKDGVITMEEGVTLTGITSTKDIPRINYELRIEARRTTGPDFFAAVTFPVGDKYCSFINGGWGGAVVGLSSIDDKDASENETTKYIGFKDNQWYQFRIRVTKPKIQVWIDDKLVIDQKIEGRKISTRTEVTLSQPLGISAWQSTSEIRKIEIVKLK